MSIKQLHFYADMGTNKSIEYLYQYSSTWDNYSLSIMFLRLLKLLKMITPFSSFLKYNICKHTSRSQKEYP